MIRGYRLRVLILHQNFPAQFKFLVVWLKKAGHEVTFLSLESHGGKYTGIRHSVISRKANAPEAVRLPGKFKLLGKKLDASEVFLGAFRQLKAKGYYPDVVIFHSGWGAGLHLRGVFPNAILAAYAEWWFKWDADDYFFEPSSIYSPKLTDKSLIPERLLNLTVSQELLEADKVWTPTYWQKSQFPDALQEKMEVFHEGVDTKFFKPKFDFPKVPQASITYATRGMEPMRGFDHLVPILKSLLLFDSSRSAAIGGKDEAKYRPLPKGHPSMGAWAKDIFSKACLEERVLWPGRLPFDEYRDFLTGSGLHIYLTRPFVPSWSLLEAMASGCLLVVSDLPATRELLGEGDAVAGLMIDHQNHGSACDSIEQLLTDLDLQRELRLRARKRAEAYDVSLCLSPLVEFLGFGPVGKLSHG